MQRIEKWRNPSGLGSRRNFVQSLNNVEHAALLQQFNSVVFGVVSLYRQQLVGGKHASDSEYNSGTRDDFCFGADRSALNFRTLLLSSFQPHGGRPATDESLYDQHVVYVEISRDSTADILTVRRFLNKVKEQMRPGDPGRPRYVVIGGDQPSYKMFVELWLESWRREKHWKERRSRGFEELGPNGSQLHEWLIPFPGFFHAEKQAMYSICKEMLDGLGLEELADCARLSKSHVAAIIKHSHARNNRAVLFNLACAMIVHLIDMILLEDATLSAQVAKLHRTSSEKVLTTDDVTRSARSSTVHAQHKKPAGSIYAATTDLVTPEVILIGETLRAKVHSRFAVGPNGKHFVDTVLFNCLLPTVGFHVLSRTGHTDVVHAFWYKHNAILHSTTHLKYQELSIFFAFFRGVLPTVVCEELFEKRPGRMVMKLLSFTGRGRFGVDRWGFGYTHTDEALEMLIVRHLKSLSMNFLGHLENSSAWLMQVSMFRALIRYMTGASRTFAPKRDEGDGGETLGPLLQFDRNACQWRTVARMLHIMREANFLGLSHRGAEWLTNVFCDPPRRLNIKADQERILNIAQEGEITSEMHASVLFPDVFGALSERDRDEHFGGKKFKKWTKCRAVVRPGKSMAKTGGSVECLEGGDVVVNTPVQIEASLPKRPKSKEAFSKIVQERRRKLGKMKDAFHEEERFALHTSNEEYLKEVLARWDKLHDRRYLISPFADCFVNGYGFLNHGAKSRFLKYSTRGNRDVVYTMNELCRATGEAMQIAVTVSRNLYDSGIMPYSTIQIDVMNSLHYRGDTGQRGTSLEDVVTGKMKSVLRPWITGPRAERLRQIHLHIDDPLLVLKQKRAEQERRDGNRKGMADESEGVDGAASCPGIEFDDDLNIPWSSLLSDRRYKDQLASLHLFCGAVAAFELLRESKKDCSVFLHGGSFLIPTTFSDKTPLQFRPRRVPSTVGRNGSKGAIILSKVDGVSGCEEDHFTVPRSRCLIFETNGTACVGAIDIQHGEAETRFVAVTTEYVDTGTTTTTSGSCVEQCQTLIVSDDTDVFMIPLCNPSMFGRGVVHALNDTVHDLDAAVKVLKSMGTCGVTLATLYCIAGCDFSPSMYGLGHESFWRPFILFIQLGGSLLPSCEDPTKNVQFLFCLLYLFRMGKSNYCTETQRKSRMTQAVQSALSPGEVLKLRKSFFVSKNAVGSASWRVDVRNYVADNSNIANELLIHPAHIKLHYRRACFVTSKYWGRSQERDISHQVVGGCTPEDGYIEDGNVLLEEKHEVKKIIEAIRDVTMSCNCGGDCSTRRCSCKKNSEKCVGCGCDEDTCLNRPKTAQSEAERTETLERVSGGSVPFVTSHNPTEAKTVVEIEHTHVSASGNLDSGSDDKSSVSSGEFEHEDINEIL